MCFEEYRRKTIIYNELVTVTQALVDLHKKSRQVLYIQGMLFVQTVLFLSASLALLSRWIAS